MPEAHHHDEPQTAPRQWPNWISPISTIILLATALSFYISDHQQLIAVRQVMQAWELHGTPQAVSLKATYDEHFRSMDARQDRLESGQNNIMSKLQDVLQTGARLEAKMDGLDGQLKQHMQQRP